MDIKPFVAPEVSFWNGVNGVTIAVAAIGLMVMIAAIILDVRRKNNPNRLFLVPFFYLIGFLAITTSFVGTILASAQIVTDAYQSHISEFNESLESEGFKILSGKPSLHANDQSSLLISYKEKSLDCTLFSPKDATTSVVFSCGETKLSLAQIKEAN